MKLQRSVKTIVLCLILLVLVVGCRRDEPETAVTVPAPEPTQPQIATPETAEIPPDNFIVIATDAPNEPFTSFDPFGKIIGLNEEIMRNIAALSDLEYEFVVTPSQGVLEALANNPNQDFDAVMSSLVVADTPPKGIAFTEPYLEIGQVLLVLADEQEIASYADIQPGMLVGVKERSEAEKVARTLLGLTDSDLRPFPGVTEAVQALVNEELRAVIVDNYTATYFAQTYPEQLKIVNGNGRDAWITGKAYTIAVAATNTDLLEKLNTAIQTLKNNQTIDDLATQWLVLTSENIAQIDPGESRVGTPADELVIGILGQPDNLDPAGSSDLINWEIKNNIMSGLYTLNSQNEIVPLLASDFPSISADGLEYTIRLRRGLNFPDGTTFTADDVKWAIDRSARLGNFLVNAFLKDANEDNFADPDAVQVVNDFTVKIVLQEPTGYFLSLLATPPYFPVSSECFGEAYDPTSTCGGIGPYTVVSWDADRLRLQANPEWPGTPAPAFEKIQLRFYDDVTRMRRSLVDFQSVDMIWTGLPYGDYVELRDLDVTGDGTPDFRAWSGPAVFKSYLIFEQSTDPWDDERVRQAVAYAVDREALSQEIFGGERLPLYSPVPDAVPGHVATLPQRDLTQARALLQAAGYSQSKPLAITIWYVNDGRYTPLEEAYASAIKQQLEETGIFQVTLSGAPWEIFQTQIFSCNYPAYLIGWPSPGKPVDFPDVLSWTEFFVQNTDTGFCSNYESREMDDLLEKIREETDTTARFALYADMQELWAEELPTLDLTQQPRWAISLPTVDNVQVDAMGFLHYELLTKSE